MEERINPESVSILRDPRYGVVAQVGSPTAPAAHQALARAGFRQLDDGRFTLDRVDGSTFAAVRETVAAMRRDGVHVVADAEFDAAPASTARAAAGLGATVQAAPPARSSRYDVAIGRHPFLGIVASPARGDSDMALAGALAEAGFTRAEGRLLALGEDPIDLVQHGTHSVARLRDQGFAVLADLAFEPLDRPYQATDPYAAELRTALDRAPASSAATVPTAGPDIQEQRADALVHDRLAMMAAIGAQLRSLDGQLRTDPGSLDLARVEAVLDEATTILQGSAGDLVSAGADVAPAQAVALGSPRARAARATSTRIAVTAAAGAQTAAAARPAVDPRIAWADHSARSR